MCQVVGGVMVFAGMMGCTVKFIYELHNTAVIIVLYGVVAGIGAGIWQMTGVLLPEDDYRYLVALCLWEHPLST